MDSIFKPFFISIIALPGLLFAGDVFADQVSQSWGDFRYIDKIICSLDEAESEIEKN